MSLAGARALLEVGRAQDALEELGPVLADPGAPSDAYCLLGAIRLRLGEPDAARQAAEQALARDPQDEQAHRVLAIALTGLGRGPEAVRAARRSVALDPEGAMPLYVLARALVTANRALEARDVVQRNLTANPDDAVAWESAALVSLAGWRWAEAETCARRGLSIAPQDPELLLLLSAALDEQGRAHESAYLAGAAVRADPEDERGREHLETMAPGLVGLVLATWSLAVLVVLGAVAVALGWDGGPLVLFGVVALVVAVVDAARISAFHGGLDPAARGAMLRGLRQRMRWPTGLLVVACVALPVTGLVRSLLA